MSLSIKLKTNRTSSDCREPIRKALLKGIATDIVEDLVYFPVIRATADAANVTLSGAYISAIMKEVDSSI